MATAGIPTIDISAFLEGESPPELVAQVVKQWKFAFENYGFCVITGHGVKSDIIENIYSKTLAFFRLSEAEKMKYCLGRGYGVGGYVPRGVESVSKSTGEEATALAPPDLVESLEFVMETVEGQQDVCLDDVTAGYTEAMHAYFTSLRKLLLQLMKLSALALNLDPNFFVPSYEHPEIHLRMGYYPKLDTGVDGLRYGPHTDYEGLTILKTDDYLRSDKLHSLEVEYKGEWIPVLAPKHGLVINAGDLIQLWTNAKWKSATHRVINSQLDTERLSLVCFTSPHKDTVVEPLQGTFTDDRDKLHAPITAGAHWREKIGRTSEQK